MSTRRKPSLPPTLHFEGQGVCFFTLGEYRCPNKGDYFVSGAEPEGYRARHHLTQEYWIVTPTHHAKQRTAYVRGDAVHIIPLV